MLLAALLVSLSQSVTPALAQWLPTGDLLWSGQTTDFSAGAGMNVMALRVAKSGAGVVVAVIDTGIDASHPDLAGQLWVNPREVAGNTFDDDGNGYADDVRGWNFATNTSDITDRAGHGTAVAGLIAAARNGSGIEGIAPGARIMVLKVGETEKAINLDDLSRAVVYAVRNGADVINISITAQNAPRDLLASIAYARRMGVVIVAAAGNDGSETSDLPGGLPGVIRVGSIGPDGAVPDFSNANPDVVAPGVQLLTTCAGGFVCAEPLTQSNVVTLTGTSFSAALVSGVAALLREGNHTITGEGLEQILRETARDVGMAGPDLRSGAGLVDAAAAAEHIGPAPSTDPQVSVGVIGTVPRETFLAQLIAARGIATTAPLAANLVFDAFHSPYAREIAAAKGRGIILGRWFHPLRPVTRYEALTLIGRTVALPEQSSLLLLPNDGTVEPQRTLLARAFAGGIGEPWTARELNSPLTLEDATRLIAAARSYDPAKVPF